MAKAAAIGVTSVAMPAMGTGVGRFPIERAAQVMVEEARKAAESGGSLSRIVFVLRDVEEEPVTVPADGHDRAAWERLDALRRAEGGNDD